MIHETESTFLYHTSCAQCGSSDGNSVFSDTHEFCFVCNHWTPPSNSEVPTQPRTSTRKGTMDLITTSIVPLLKRGISAETCAKFNYGVGTHNGIKYQVAPYYKDGQLVAQHLRDS